ncbi:MAG: hypothetical protein NTY03_01435 [Candidatus Bathyarchaeota archaeon]|nr:hypothetical protein [Candidatus Bathyarchaeota archaeon]
MVDLALLQSVSYIAGASGVCIAAIFYVLNLRISQRNMRQTLDTRKLQFVTSITNQLTSEEGERRYAELTDMEWSDYDDFEKKYGSDYNIDNLAKRMSVWKTYNTLGMLIREKLIEPEVIYAIDNVNSCFVWKQFKEVIAENRRRYGGKDNFSDFEFLNNEMLRIKSRMDPSYKVPDTGGKYVPEKFSP